LFGPGDDFNTKKTPHFLSSQQKQRHECGFSNTEISEFISFPEPLSAGAIINSEMDTEPQVRDAMNRHLNPQSPRCACTSN
jgi:hypothetical protein